MKIDTPISEESDDKLDFGGIAEQLGGALAQDVLSKGFVIGVEGSWGSGKSSLINLALKRLNEKEDSQDKKPTIVRFSPWIVGNRDELLQQLFTELRSVIVKAGYRGKVIDSLLDQYCRIASPLADIVGIVDTFIPGTRLLTKGIDITGKAASKAVQLPLSELNHRLREELRQIEQRIVVFIDDIDRLEPAESVEVLRLVRAVADFPNLIYLLAYDAEALSSNIEKTISIPDGKAFLEKIVQASFVVPKPDIDDLKIWMMEEIKTLGIAAKDDIEAGKLQESIRIWCDRFISSPRDIVRVLNSIKLYVMPQKELLNPADAVFLQIVRIKCRPLYAWIEEFLWKLHDLQTDLDYLSYLSGAGSIPPSDDRLEAIVSDLVSKNDADKGKFMRRLFQHITGRNNTDQTPYSQDEISQYDKDRRLASRYHFRLYFAFSVRSRDVSEDKISRFLKLCVDDQRKAVNQFIELSKTYSSHGGMMGKVLLDRIFHKDNLLTPQQIEGFLLVLSDSIHELVLRTSPNSGPAEFLRGGKDQVISLVKHLNAEQRQNVLETLFKNTRSLAWLSGIVISSIIQQSPSDRQELDEYRLLTSDEHNLVCEIFVKRLETEPKALLQTSPPYFLQVLEAWRLAGNQQKVMAWIKDQSSNDSEFMDLLSKMKSWSNHSDTGVQYTILAETLKKYFPDHEVQARLTKIYKDNSGKMREQANQLLKSIEESATRFRS